MLSWHLADSHVHVIGKALVITYMLYVHKWSARILGAGNVLNGLSLGVDEGPQIVEITYPFSQKDRNNLQALCTLILLSSISSESVIHKLIVLQHNIPCIQN